MFWSETVLTCILLEHAMHDDSYLLRLQMMAMRTRAEHAAALVSSSAASTAPQHFMPHALATVSYSS